MILLIQRLGSGFELVLITHPPQAAARVLRKVSVLNPQGRFCVWFVRSVAAPELSVGNVLALLLLLELHLELLLGVLTLRGRAFCAHAIGPASTRAGNRRPHAVGRQTSRSCSMTVSVCTSAVAVCPSSMAVTVRSAVPIPVGSTSSSSCVRDRWYGKLRAASLFVKQVVRKRVDEILVCHLVSIVNSMC